MIKDKLLNLGYNTKEIEYILSYYPICNFKEETLEIKVNDIFNHLLSLGYTSKEIITMTLHFRGIYTRTIMVLDKRL